MEVIGLDLSLTSTGVASSEGTFCIQSQRKAYRRLIEIRDELMAFVDKFEDPVAIIEGYAFARTGAGTFALGELGGVIRVALLDREIPWAEVAPTARAKFATGKGNAPKAEVVSTISAKTGIVWSGKGADDKCDAWIIREMGLVKFGLSEYTWPELNMQPLQKIDWTLIESR